MSERVWFRSLYWRVAVGFVSFLALVLIVQGGVLIWLLARGSDDMTGRTPYDLATLVASDLSTTFASEDMRDPSGYLREHYGGVSRPVVVVFPDGRTVASHEGVQLPPVLLDLALRRMRMAARTQGAGRFNPGALPQGAPNAGEELPPPPPDGWPGQPPPQQAAPDRRRAPERFGAGPPMGRGRAIGSAPVFLQGRIAAIVVVPPVEPLPLLLRQFAPVAGGIGIGLLVVATALAALFVFGPAQRRLRALEDAARQLGAGVQTARAPVAGGDEVTAVARAFNAMADELDRRATALLTATDARRQLLADVSHELMTPLTAMRGYLETLQMAELSLSDDARRRYLAIVSAETERLERIVGDLLDLARLEAGGTAFAQEPVDLALVFQRVVERHEREARSREIHLTTHVDPTTPSVTGDAGRLEQVLQNLAANALRHTPAGGRVELISERRGSQVALLVRDTGEGIPPDRLDRVFDRFYKADDARGADGRGSGLGLSIAKAIVERLGGQIGVRSDPGRETVFEILLPASDQPVTRSAEGAG